MTSLSTNVKSPIRGEVWLVKLDPAIGSEIKKTRPAIVISADVVGKLPVKLVVPITDWKPYFANNTWHVKLSENSTNGLSKTSAADILQMRGVDLQRFVRKLGYLSKPKTSEIALKIAAVVEASL